MTMKPRISFAGIALLGAALLGGCTTFGLPGAPLPGVLAVTPAKPFDTGPAQPDPNDDLELGKRQFAATNYGLAEQHFRRAVERSTGPRSRDAEAWLGLAASYDRLRRFDLADRAYSQAIAAIGPTPEVLNNQGYSFLLRKDYKRARVLLMRAHAQDPKNLYVSNNIALLDASEGPRAH